MPSSATFLTLASSPANAPTVAEATAAALPHGPGIIANAVAA